MSEGWASSEFSVVDLGDERLDKRLVKLCDSFSESPESPINQACADWSETKAAYRFFRNDKVSASQIMAAHYEKTRARVLEKRVVLAIQDTSYLSYTHHPKTSGLGKISINKGKNIKEICSYGLLMHSTLAVTTDGVPLGFLDQQITARSVTSKNKSQKDAAPIQDKESYRWLEALKNSQLSSKDTRVVTVCDREADMYELFYLAEQLEAPLLVRASYNRAVDKHSMYSEQPVVFLWDRLEAAHTSGTITIDVPARRTTKNAKEREARTATLEVKFCSFKFNPPKRLSSKLPDLIMSAVYLKEENPPADVEPIEWMLLTNIPVENFEQAVEKIQWYCLRWRIEMFHKVLKSGFQVEECRLSDGKRLIRYLTIMSIVAWRLFMITLVARSEPNMSVSKLLSDTEWKVLYSKINKGKQPPEKAPTVAEAVIWIARLGGFLARKSDGYPGTIVLWRGWKRLADLVEGWTLARSC